MPLVPTPKPPKAEPDPRGRKGTRGHGPAGGAGLRNRAGALALCCACLPGAALPQTASEVTPQSFRPDLRPLSGSVEFTGAGGLAAPAGAEKLSVDLSGVVLDGALPQMAEANEAIRARLLDGRISVAEIFAAASDLQTAYIDAGYVLTRVVLPAQSLVDGGGIRIVVINGFVEKIDDAAVPEKVRGRVAEVTAPLVGRKGVGDELERRLLIAGDTPGIALSSAIATGQTPGGTLLSLEGRYRPVTGFLGFDNSVGEELGGWSMDASLELNSLLGLGEMFYFWASGHPVGGTSTVVGDYFDDNPQLRTLAAGAIFPIGNDGLTFNVEYTDSRTTPEVDGLESTSTFNRTAFRLRYPFIRSQVLNVNGQLSFDIQSEDMDLIIDDTTLPVYSDEVRVLRLAGDMNKLFVGSDAIFDGAVVLSQGIEGLGADTPSSDASVPFSRDGARADFTKLEISGDYTRPFPADLALAISGKAQTSFGQPLVKAEQIGIVGPLALSTFDAGTMTGDSGWVLRGEFSKTHAIRSRYPLEISPYLFAGLGATYLERPTEFEQSTVQASSFGVGVDLLVVRDPRYSDAALRAEFGKGYRDDLDDDESRFTVYGSWRF